MRGIPVYPHLRINLVAIETNQFSHGSFEIFKCLIKLRERKEKGGREGEREKGREGETREVEEVKRYETLLWYLPLLILVLILDVLFVIILNL